MFWRYTALSFFYGQESLTILQWAIRGVVAYLILLMSVKILGQRSISQLRLLDFIIALILGNILAHPLSDEGLGMTGSITTTIVLVVMYTLSLKLTLKSRKLEQFFSPPPLPVIRNGEIIYKNLIKARISVDFLLSELRLGNVDDIKKIAIALWEPGGRISSFLDTAFQPLTPNDMQIVKNPFSLPIVIIKDGVIETNALQDIKRTKNWLIDILNRTYNAEVKSILLATIDTNYNIQVYFK
jgi:uncharacterized membrane protein YcaP (DUF421 family)